MANGKPGEKPLCYGAWWPGARMSIRFILTNVHGALDCSASAANLAFPRLFRLEDAPRAALVPRLVGAVGTGHSLITAYELGALKVLPIPARLALDAAKGVFMASSPWLFGFARNGTRYWLPHLLMGMADVLAAATSETS